MQTELLTFEEVAKKLKVKSSTLHSLVNLNPDFKKHTVKLSFRRMLKPTIFNWLDENKFKYFETISLDGEEWKQIKKHPKYYISNMGRIVSTVSFLPKLLKVYIDRDGYARTYLKAGRDNHGVTYSVHRLVMLHFVPKKQSDKYEVNHLNFNKQDNRLENLEWCTRFQNLQHQHENRMGNYKLRTEEIELVKEYNELGYSPQFIAIALKTTKNKVIKALAEAA